MKPANLLLRSDGVLKVSDFGIAHTGDGTQLTQVGTILGTTAYLAPEQARGEQVGPQADVFSLGVVLYEALTGAPPWKVESLAQVAAVGDTPPTPVRSLAPGVPRDVESAIMRSLSREPRGRPADALCARARAGARNRASHGAPRPGHARPTAAAAGSACRGSATSSPRSWPRRCSPSSSGWRRAETTERRPRPGQPAKIAPVPAADDPAGQARNLEQWIRDHTKGGG